MLARNTPTTSPLTVALQSSQPTRLTVPASVTIPAGQSSVTFALNTINNAAIDGPVDAAITASAVGINSASDVVEVSDDDLPTISLTIAADSVVESAGNPATSATVTRSVARRRRC